MAVHQRNNRPAETGMVIFEDAENAENAGCRRGKRAVQAQRVPLQERTASVQNATKLQPLKQPKSQGVGTEKCGQKCFSHDVASSGQEVQPEPAQRQFAIYQDASTAVPTAKCPSAECKEDQEQMEVLHPSVTNMFKPDVVTVSAVCENEFEDTSSVVMDSPDMSVSDDGAGDDVATVCNEKYLWFPEYKTDIYQYLRTAEVRHAARPDYMRKQVDITHSMRSILIDWMVEVAEEYKLDRETLCLAVLYVDRFLSLMAVARGKLQLVGAAAMFVASKYEEIYPPEVNEFVYITDNTYTKKQLLQMERMILRALSFDVASPTVNWFCLALLNDLQAGERTMSLSMYLAELTMLDGERFLKYLPSIIGASCVCVAHHTLGYGGFMEMVTLVTGYSFAQLNLCITDLFAVLTEAPKLPHPAIREKYAKEKWHCVSEICPAEQSVPVAFS